MGKINSNRKGKVGEREAAKLLREHGFDAQRGQQYRGGSMSPDVVHSIPRLHLEVKRTEQLRLWAALDQAKEDATYDHVPIVLHRPSKREWVVVMPADKFLTIMQYAICGGWK